MSKISSQSLRVTLVWLALIVATTISWQLGHGAGLNDRQMAGVGILIIAIIKVRYVLLDFMELRHAPLAMRFGIEAWAVLAATAMSVVYLNGHP